MSPKEHLRRNLGRITASTMKKGERMKTELSTWLSFSDCPLKTNCECLYKEVASPRDDTIYICTSYNNNHLESLSAPVTSCVRTKL